MRSSSLIATFLILTNIFKELYYYEPHKWSDFIKAMIFHLLLQLCHPVLLYEKIKSLHNYTANIRTLYVFTTHMLLL